MPGWFNSSKLNEFVDPKTAVAILRILAAFFLIYGHGYGKLTNVLGGDFQFLDPIGIGPGPSLVLATFAEAICAFLVLIGLWTRLASLIVVLNMAVVVFIFHLPAGDFLSGMEDAVLYLVIFVVIFLTGPGKYSFDDANSG